MEPKRYREERLSKENENVIDELDYVNVDVIKRQHQNYYLGNYEYVLSQLFYDEA